MANNNWGYQRPLELLRLDNSKLKDQIRQLTQRQLQDNRGGGQGGGSSSMRVGFTSTAISARSGATPGTGYVNLCSLTGGTLTSLDTVTVYNMGDEIDGSIAVHCYKDVEGNWWVSPEECSG